MKVKQRYKKPAAIKDSNGTKWRELTIFAAPNKSTMVITPASALPCSMKITSFPYAGSALRKVPGRIIRRYRVDIVIPHARAASISP